MMWAPRVSERRGQKQEQQQAGMVVVVAVAAGQERKEGWEQRLEMLMGRERRGQERLQQAREWARGKALERERAHPQPLACGR